MTVYQGAEAFATHNPETRQTRIAFLNAELTADATWDGSSHSEPVFSRAPLPEQRELASNILARVADDLRGSNNG